LTKALWVAREASLLPLQDSMIEKVNNELRRYQIDASLLLSGFDGNHNANIIAVHHPGIASNETNSGFAAIGSGAQMAVGRLLWQKATRSEHLEVVLYEAYDAKAHAEEIQGVGYASDIRIIVKGRIVSPPPKIRNLIDNVLEVATMTPFGKKSSMPTGWQRTLRAFRQTVMRQKRRRRVTKRRRSKRR
jgi:hypothetical protein